MIGDVLKRMRIIYGYKASEMSSELGISASYLSEIEVSNIFGPLSLEILAASRLPGGFSWPFPLFFPLRDFYKGKLSAFTYYLIQRPGRRTLGLFLCMGVDVHGGVHAGKAQQLSDIFKDATP